SLVDEIVPDLHVSHLRIAPDALAIRAHDRLSCLLAPSLVAPHKTNGDSGAGSKALEVPFPRPGMDLVEVVDREDEAAFGRSINAEVGNVHVAAAHHLHAGDRSGREIVDHDGGGAAQEGKGRSEHAGIAHRHELGYASLVLLF